MLDAGLDKNLNCAFQKNIQPPVSQKGHSSSYYLLLSSVSYRSLRKCRHNCAALPTNPPLTEDLQTQGMRHLLKAAQTLGEPVLSQELQLLFAVFKNCSAHLNCGWNKCNPRPSNIWFELLLVSDSAHGFPFLLCTSKKVSGSVFSAP